MNKLFTPKEELLFLIKQTAGRAYQARDRIKHYVERVAEAERTYDKAWYRRSLDYAKDEHELLIDILKEITETYRRSYGK